MRSDLAIVVPALNEAGTIGPLVKGLAKIGRVIVVDDGSSDGTGRIARDNGAQTVTHETNRGYDGALDSGFARAAELGCHYIVTLDADGQHPEEMIANFVDAMENGADLVIGIRDRLQRHGERLFALLARARYGIRDPLCGMKGYRTALYRKLGHFDSYRSIGTELALFAASSGAKIVQIPLKTRDRADAPRFGSSWRAELRLLRAIAIGFARYGLTRLRP